MAVSANEQSSLKGRKLNTRIVLLSIASILIAAFLIYFLYKEIKDEKDFKNHIDKEHHHSIDKE